MPQHSPNFESLTLCKVDSASGKRKRSDSDTEDEGQEFTDLDDAQPDNEDDEEEGQDYHGPKAPKAVTTGKKSKPKTKGSPAHKKSRTTKVPVPKAPKTTTRKPRKGKATDDAFDAAKVAKDTKINGDNPLFSANLFCSISRVKLILAAFRCHPESLRCSTINSGGLPRVTQTDSWASSI